MKVALSIALFALFVPLTARAVPGAGGLPTIAAKAGLSQAQVSKIKQLSFAIQRKLIRLKAKLQIKQLELQQAMAADTAPSERKVVAMVEGIGQLETEMLVPRKHDFERKSC
jgi:hypothetical protein